ncbi:MULTISPECIES: MltR family transcriptional regulator [Vibrio]|uniref:Mannitol repressor protein n=1 Tax=Vibrio nigripulchritudo SOn1 TaxID=1238450 RepID=A0AAV2VT41_9VIBR|nr:MULTISPECIES: MltR family transcriptional regulator [Vibrio]UAB73525.1 MltR family transcriptional regulator [Vibrio sp. SCSIO 43132]CCN70115.1 mannitol repressor protein [Vibrio nigripulchritudo SFn118]CCO47757.1 mannitol repressor protein [Vibrio nigripulchritudo SOn1]
MEDIVNETEIIERLNSASSVRGFFITAVDVFNLSIDGLMQRIFRKDNFAVQSVVGPLLQDSGPLGDLSVRLKLLFGLGVLTDEIYNDIDSIIKIKNQLNSDTSEYEFTDPSVLNPIKKLHLVKNVGLAQLEVCEPDGDIDLDFYQLQLQRQQQIVKSGLSLAIVEICNELGKESPF